MARFLILTGPTLRLMTPNGILRFAESEAERLTQIWLAPAIHRVRRARRLPRHYDRVELATDALTRTVLTWDATQSPFGAWLSIQIQGVVTQAKRRRESAVSLDTVSEADLPAVVVRCPIEESEAVHAILSRVAPPDRLVLASIVFDELTAAQIARANRVSQAAVSQWISRNRPRIQAYLERDRCG